MQRGTLSSGSITNVTHTRDWMSGTGTGLDALGNWRSVTTDAVQQTRTHDSQNRLTGVGSATLAYDDNGNVFTDDNSRTYTYDAWNRLIGVVSGPTDTYYMYDALGRRIQTMGIGVAPVADHYHSKDWQVIEERDSNTGAVTAQNVWSLEYVDAMVLRDRDATTGGNLGKTGSGLDERLHAVHDANFNVTAVVDTSGAVVERYQYDPYGSFTVLDANFAGDADGASDVGWLHQFQGGRYEPATGLYHFNNGGNGRDVSATLGRAVQQDRWRQNPNVPTAGDGYPDGLNRYEWERSNPIFWLDPRGTESIIANDFLNFVDFMTGSVVSSWMAAACERDLAQKDKERAIAALGSAQGADVDSVNRQLRHGGMNGFAAAAENTIEATGAATSMGLGGGPAVRGTLPAGWRPIRDKTGKVHTPPGTRLPNYLSDDLTREELEEAAEELCESIRERERLMKQLGEESRHRDRIREEQALLRNIRKRLSGS